MIFIRILNIAWSIWCSVSWGFVFFSKKSCHAKRSSGCKIDSKKTSIGNLIYRSLLAFAFLKEWSLAAWRHFIKIKLQMDSIISFSRNWFKIDIFNSKYFKRFRCQYSKKVIKYNLLQNKKNQLKTRSYLRIGC